MASFYQIISLDFCTVVHLIELKGKSRYQSKELSMAVEEALVKCLEMCADFNYPMGKKKLQNLVQSYCVENNVDTRWKGHRPGKDWVRLFKKRWSHRVKVRKPTNIKRSRAKV
jgi:hypothetical protein